MQLTNLLLPTFLSVLASALPCPSTSTLQHKRDINVTSLPVAGCSSFPGYVSDTEPTSPFLVQAVQNGSPIEGNGLTYVLFQPNVHGNDIGRIVIPTNNQFAKMPFRCNPLNSTYPIEGYTPNGWTSLTVSPYPYDAELMWGVWGPPLTAYTHDASGSLGIFLGSHGVTTWGVMDEDATYWDARLLGPGSEISPNSTMYPGEVQSFLKVLPA